MRLDKTHDPDLRSWIDSANAPDCDFPIHGRGSSIVVSGTRIVRPHGQTKAPGDEVIERGYCRSDNALRIGFGEAAGAIKP